MSLEAATFKPIVADQLFRADGVFVEQSREAVRALESLPESDHLWIPTTNKGVKRLFDGRARLTAQPEAVLHNKWPVPELAVIGATVLSPVFLIEDEPDSDGPVKREIVIFRYEPGAQEVMRLDGVPYEHVWELSPGELGHADGGYGSGAETTWEPVDEGDVIRNLDRHHGERNPLTDTMHYSVVVL